MEYLFQLYLGYLYVTQVKTENDGYAAVQLMAISERVLNKPERTLCKAGSNKRYLKEFKFENADYQVGQEIKVVLQPEIK